MRKKRIAVFYMSSRRSSINSSPVLVGALKFPAPVVYVRAEIVSADSLEEALEKARPRRGEVVMNSHYVK